MNHQSFNQSQTTNWPTLLLAKSANKENSFALFAIVVSIFVFKPALFLNFGNLFIGGTGGDTAIYLWLSNLFPFFLTPSHWFETNGFYPYSGTLAFSDNWILPGALYGIFKLINLSDAAAWNLVIVVAQSLFGFFSYLLFFALSENFLVSILFGVLIPELSPFQAHLGHPQLQCGWIIPLAILLMLRWIETKENKYAFLSGFTLSLSFLCSIYLTLFTGYLIGIIFIVFCLLRATAEHVRPLGQFLIYFVAGLFPSVPFILPYREVISAFGNRGLWEPQAFQASILSYVSYGTFHETSFLYSSLSHSEANLGIGILLLILMLATYISLIRANQAPFFLTLLGLLTVTLGVLTIFPIAVFQLSTLVSWLIILTLLLALLKVRKGVRNAGYLLVSNFEIMLMLFSAMILFLLLSFGPIVSPSIASWNPFYVAFYYLPGLSGIRAVSRAGLVVTFLMTLIGFLFLTLQYGKRNIPFVVVVAIIVGGYAENLTVQYPLEPKAATVSSLEKLTSSISSNDIVITLPYGDINNDRQTIKNFFSFASLQNQTLLHLTTLHASAINGFTGVKTKLINDLPAALDAFPSDQSISYLSQFIGLTKIILLPEYFEHRDFQATIQALSLIKSPVHLISIDETERIALLEFTSERTISSGHPENLIVPSGTKQITCQLSCATKNQKCAENPAPSFSAFFAHNKEPVPATTYKNDVILSVPPATKHVPFLTITITTNQTTGITFRRCSMTS